MSARPRQLNARSGLERLDITDSAELLVDGQIVLQTRQTLRLIANAVARTAALENLRAAEFRFGDTLFRCADVFDSDCAGFADECVRLIQLGLTEATMSRGEIFFI